MAALINEESFVGWLGLKQQLSILREREREVTSNQRTERWGFSRFSSCQSQSLFVLLIRKFGRGESGGSLQSAKLFNSRVYTPPSPPPQPHFVSSSFVFLGFSLGFSLSSGWKLHLIFSFPGHFFFCFEPPPIEVPLLRNNLLKIYFDDSALSLPSPQLFVNEKIKIQTRISSSAWQLTYFLW